MIFRRERRREWIINGIEEVGGKEEDDLRRENIVDIKKENGKKGEKAKSMRNGNQ